MSLVATWVQATDGKFYENPILFGEGWYVCFDDDDPPEIVISEKLFKSKDAFQILEEAGVPHRNVRDGHRENRMFPNKVNLKWKWKEAWSYFFVLDGPIPVPTRFDSVEHNPTGQGVYYRLKKETK